MLLVGFFLSIGLAGAPTLEHVAMALLLMLILPFKSALFFWLLTRFRLRARSGLLASLSLSNYSEFGLIVAAVSVANGWLSSDWLLIMALAVSISFVVAAPLNASSHRIYGRLSASLSPYESERRHPEDKPLEIGDSKVVVFGMGRIGRGAHDALSERYGEAILGIDSDPEVVAGQRAEGRRVLLGDATDSDFWERVGKQAEGGVRLAVLAMSEHLANLHAVERMRAMGYGGFIAALATHGDEAAELEEAGADLAVDIYAEAGSGFAADVMSHLEATTLT